MKKTIKPLSLVAWGGSEKGVRRSMAWPEWPNLMSRATPADSEGMTEVLEAPSPDQV